ncbi:MAG: PBSX family phage terminase large subunit [Alphaproteobacteria bacterium]|nr:PBSX family phage terminase large subunit [Alphaproteobacteria bacterium]
MGKTVEISVARPFLPLLTEKKRIKFFHGGRGGGKSYAFADALLMKGLQQPLFIACLREIQDTIKDSVHKLLSDRISAYDLEEYEIKESEIVNRLNGTRFIFKGLRDQDPQKIKSLEGVDIAWIEEAQTITKKSWDILSPTIRKDGSEIWISMNREEENDPLWVALAAQPDDRTMVVKVNYYDNPFCPEELKLQALSSKNKDWDEYLHIWEGEPVQQGDKKLISAKAVKRAYETKIDNANSTQPLIVGCDPARFGDDACAICYRRGRQAYHLKTYRKQSVVDVANILTSIVLNDKPVRINIDVGGLGAGVYDLMVDRGYGDIVRAVNFGSKAQDEERYGNRRAEMWARINNWLNGELPVSIIDKEQLLLTDLTAPEKKYDRLSRLLLEAKDDIKKRIGRSTDIGDALALTFAEAFYPMGLADRVEELSVDDNVYL